MIKYETLFVIKPDLPEEEIQAVLDRLQDRLGRVDAKAVSIRHWGNQELAYSVRYRGEVFRRGYYILFTYIGNGSAVEEVERNLKILDNAFRYVTVRLESGVDPGSITEVEITHHGPRSHVRGYRQQAEDAVAEDVAGDDGAGPDDASEAGGEAGDDGPEASGGAEETEAGDAAAGDDDDVETDRGVDDGPGQDDASDTADSAEDGGSENKDEE